MRKKLLTLLIVCAIAGVGVSAYSVFMKYGVTSGEFCTVGETFDCDIVNSSPYSEIAGIPVSLIGVLGYAFLIIAAAMKLKQPQDKQLSLLLLIASGGALLFSLYLTSIEAFVLKTWCMLCLMSQGLIIPIFLSAVGVWRLDKNAAPPSTPEPSV